METTVYSGRMCAGNLMYQFSEMMSFQEILEAKEINTFVLIAISILFFHNGTIWTFFCVNLPVPDDVEETYIFDLMMDRMTKIQFLNYAYLLIFFQVTIGHWCPCPAVTVRGAGFSLDSLQVRRRVTSILFILSLTPGNNLEVRYHGCFWSVGGN